MANKPPGSSVAQSAPFLSLPAEVLQMIFVEYYKEITLVTEWSVKSSNKADYPFQVERICKRLREQSAAARSRTTERPLIIQGPGSYDYFLRDVSARLCNDKARAWLRNSVASLKIECMPSIFWDHICWEWILSECPRLNEFEFCAEEQSVYINRTAKPYLPLNSEYKKRRVAQILARSDEDRWHSTDTLKGELHYLAATFHSCYPKRESSLRMKVVFPTIMGDVCGKWEESFEHVCTRCTTY